MIDKFRYLLLAVAISTLFLVRGALAQEELSRQYIIQGIELVGNSKTNPEVIYRHLSFQVGDVFPSREVVALLEKNRRRLLQSNFFKSVEFSTEPGPEKGELVVVIEVKERGWLQFQLEGGHGELDGWYFVPASLSLNNLFGQGNYISAKWILSDLTDKVSLAVRTPGLFGPRVLLDAELFEGTTDFIHYLDALEAKQQVDFSGLNLKLSVVDGPLKFLFIKYRDQQYDARGRLKFADVDSSTSTLPPKLSRSLLPTDVNGLTVGLYRDDRDDTVYPMNGLWGAASAEWVSSWFGGGPSFLKVNFDGRLYKPIGDHEVLALHLEAGLTGEAAPFFERPYLGGPLSLRGYRDRRLTPIGGGTKLLLINTEYRFPLTKKNFPHHKSTGVFFFDAGGIWSPGETPKIEDIYTSVGVGFRIKLPVVGITRFDFGFPLRIVDNNHFTVQISLGHAF